MRKRNKQITGWIIIISMILLCLVFLALEEYHDSQSKEVVFIPKVADETNDFWMTMINGAESAAKEYGIQMTILSPDVENNYEMQKELIREAIAQKPDVIALAPILYSGMTEDVQQIADAGIKLVLIDSRIDKELEECYVGTDNMEVGILVGKKMKEYVTEDTHIAIMSHVKESSTAMEREKGMREGLGEEEYRIKTVLYSNSDYEQAYMLTKELLSENPEINLIGGLNLYSTVGVARAVKEMGLQEHVKIVGVDNDIEGIQYLEEGVIEALIVQKPFEMGYFGIQKAAGLINGGSVETIVNSGIATVTKDNIYTGENEKLLFPF